MPKRKLGNMDDDPQNADWLRDLNTNPALRAELNLPPLSEAVTAAANEDKLKGGMIALVPSDADLDRIALSGAEPREALHLTLWFLADDASELSDEAVEAFMNIGESVADAAGPVTAMAFGLGLWNWQGDSPSIVLNIGDTDKLLTGIRAAFSDSAADALLNEWTAIQDQQHYPWVPHVCLAYSDDLDDVNLALEKLGPITFDALRVAIGGVDYDYQLGGGDA